MKNKKIEVIGIIIMVNIFNQVFLSDFMTRQSPDKKRNAKSQ